MADTEHLGHRREGRRIRPMPREDATVAEIGPHAQMREQPRILEHDAHAAPMRRQEQSGGGIDQRGAVERDPAPVWPGEPGDQVDQRRLSRTRAPEQGGEPQPGREGGFEGECSAPKLDVDLDAHAVRLA
jgi:hypothetical protein